MTSCSSCGTHTGMHWPDCPFGSQPHYSANQLRKREEEMAALKSKLEQAKALVDELLDSMEGETYAVKVLRTIQGMLK